MNTRSSRSVDIIVPAYNEAEGIHTFLTQLCDNLRAINDHLGASRLINWTIIIINDGSKDETESIIRNFQSSTCRIQYIALAANYGHQAALWCGLRASESDACITIDADGQDPPEAIKGMIESWLNGSLIVAAKRSKRIDTPAKKFTAFLFYRFITALGSNPKSNDIGDFRLMDQLARKALLKQSSSLQYLRGQIWNLGLPISIVSINRRGRIAGSTKYTLAKMTNLAINSILSVNPVRGISISIGIALLMTLINMSGIAYMLLAKALQPDLFSPGTTTLAMMILVGNLSAVMLSTLIALFTLLLFKSERGDPIYIVRSQEKIQ